MDSFHVKGGIPLQGTVQTDTAKNAALPIMAASILGGGESVIERCPRIDDVRHMGQILQRLGCEVTRRGEDLSITPRDLNVWEMPDALSKQLRSSIFMLGPLLARHRRARVTYPGGCEIGIRPIDLHLHVLRTLGVRVREENGYLDCDGGGMRAADIHLDYPSVGATENAMMASVFLPGVTSISNAAREPEICDLARYINAMGGSVRGEGSNYIQITGVRELRGVRVRPIPDRIVAGTLLAAAAITGGEIELTDAPLGDMTAIVSKLREMGCRVTATNTGAYLRAPRRLKAIPMLQTQPHPGFPTDMQVQMLALCTVAEGTSMIVENVFENRFSHAGDLIRMGADIRVNGRTAVITGTTALAGMRVCARDLRGGAALLLAGLKAEGDTFVEQAHLIDRGYASLENTLTRLGAIVTRTTD